MSYESSVVVPLPVDETFALVTQPDRLRRWNSIAARIDLRAGGEFRWNIVPGAYAAGTVTEVEPGKRVVFGWGWEGSDVLPPDASTVTITLEPTSEGTVVRLVHDGLDAEQAVEHAKGWDHYLERLVAAGADSDAGPDSWTVDAYDEQKSAEATLAIAQRVLRQTTRADHSNATPCSKFNVAEVVEHLSGSIKMLGGAGGAEFSTEPTGDLEVDVADLAQPALEAWAKRGMDGTVNVGIDMPAPVALGILSVEFLVHAWDVATATGQKLEVDEELASYVLGLSERVVNDELRAQVGFDPAITPAPDATGLEKLIAFTGRAA